MTNKKGNDTRNMILEKAAALLNRQGYLAFSMSGIMAETGLEKGGIYNHFKSKEDLAFQAFDYSVELALARFWRALDSEEHAADQLRAMIQAFPDKTMPLPGGCPIMNAAIEADDAHPKLLEKVRAAMDLLRHRIADVVREGIARQEIRRETSPEFVATILISTLEGALMMSKLYQDSEHLQRAVTHLCEYVSTISSEERSFQ